MLLATLGTPHLGFASADDIADRAFQQGHSKSFFAKKFGLVLNPVEKILEGVFTEIFDIFAFSTSEVGFGPFFKQPEIEIVGFCHFGLRAGSKKFFFFNLWTLSLYSPQMVWLYNNYPWRNLN